MVQALFSLIVLAFAALAGAVAGAMYPDTLHPHAWLGPCRISHLVGEAGNDPSRAYQDSLKWRVTAGDVLVCENRGVQLAGFDSPDVATAACPAAADIGRRARDRVAELLRTRSWSLTRLGVPAEPDASGRFRARLYLDDGEIKDLLVAEGLAKPWDGTGDPPTWCEGAS